MKPILPLTLAAAAMLAVPRPAAALFGVGDVVFDPANFAQHVQILREHVEQAERLRQQVEQTERMLRDLDLSRLDETLTQMGRVHDTLERIADSLGPLDTRFPHDWNTGDGAGVDGDPWSPGETLTPRQAEWRAEHRTRATQLVGLHAQVGRSIASTQQRVGELVEASGSAEGQLAAQQATNELLAVQVQQLQELQALEVAALRAELEAVAADVSEDEYNAQLHRAMHEDHVRNVESINDAAAADRRPATAPTPRTRTTP